MTSTTSPPADPTLSTLVPLASRARSLLAVLGGVFVLLLALAAVTIAKPQLESGYGAGADWTEGSGRLVTRYWVTPSTWPSVTFQSVADVPGAQVRGAWLVDANAQIDVASPGAEGDPLPARAGGDQVQGVILWEVTDCSATPREEPTVSLTSPLGLSARASLSPGMPLLAVVDDLTDQARCP